MLKRMIAGLVGLVLAAGAAGAQEKSRLERILESGKLRVGTTGDSAPPATSTR